jgi:tRNA G26 N,N-dimethylase Trm1
MKIEFKSPSDIDQETARKTVVRFVEKRLGKKLSLSGRRAIRYAFEAGIEWHTFLLWVHGREGGMG